MRSAAWLKVTATAATSSWPEASTRCARSPAPKACTPRFKSSSRRVSRRTTGKAPAATATNSKATRINGPSACGKPIAPSTGRPGSHCGPPSSGGGAPPLARLPIGRPPNAGPAACSPSIGPRRGCSSRSGPPAAPCQSAGSVCGPPSDGGRRSVRRASHSVRPSSSRTAAALRLPSASRRKKLSEAAMRTPRRSSSASGTRSRPDHSRRASACSATGASLAGKARCTRSAQAASRSLAAASKRTRSCSIWRCHIQPDTNANKASAATTVSQMRR